MAGPPFPTTLLEFQAQFNTEAACAAYLYDSRWPDGFEARAANTGVPDRRGSPMAAFQTLLGLGTQCVAAPLESIRYGAGLPQFPVKP